jgi:large subunit ribosomal protein L40
MRSRKLPAITAQEEEYRRLLMKKWATYRNEQILNDYTILDRMAQSQKKALDELRFESEELYQQAIQPDIEMIPLVIEGPVATPPIKKYSCVDGDYINTTKVYEGEEPEK